jgi:hypothetical protein
MAMFEEELEKSKSVLTALIDQNCGLFMPIFNIKKKIMVF